MGDLIPSMDPAQSAIYDIIASGSSPDQWPTRPYGPSLIPIAGMLAGLGDSVSGIGRSVSDQASSLSGSWQSHGATAAEGAVARFGAYTAEVAGGLQAAATAIERLAAELEAFNLTYGAQQTLAWHLFDKARVLGSVALAGGTPNPSDIDNLKIASAQIANAMRSACETAAAAETAAQGALKAAFDSLPVDVITASAVANFEIATKGGNWEDQYVLTATAAIVFNSLTPAEAALFRSTAGGSLIQATADNLPISTLGASPNAYADTSSGQAPFLPGWGGTPITERFPGEVGILATMDGGGGTWPIQHETGHAVNFGALTPAQQTQINALYAQDVKSGHWLSGYAKTNASEYFAEATAAYFDVPSRPGGPNLQLNGDPDHGHRPSREWLQLNNPPLYHFLQTVYPNAPVS